MTDVSNHLAGVLVGARKPKESWRDRFHHWLMELQYLRHADEAEQYAYVLVDGKPVKHVVVEPPRLGARNWVVAEFGTAHEKRVASTHIVRITGSLGDSGMGK